MVYTLQSLLVHTIPEFSIMLCWQGIFSSHVYVYKYNTVDVVSRDSCISQRLICRLDSQLMQSYDISLRTSAGLDLHVLFRKKIKTSLLIASSAAVIKKEEGKNISQALQTSYVMIAQFHFEDSAMELCPKKATLCKFLGCQTFVKQN